MSIKSKKYKKLKRGILSIYTGTVGVIQVSKKNVIQISKSQK